MDILSKLKDLGYTSIESSWYDYVKQWNDWYKGTVDSFHSFSVWNGSTKVDCTRYSLGMAKKICEDWANLLMNEKVKITLEGNGEQEFIDQVFSDNDFEVNMNELQEKGAARGTYAIVPRIVDARLTGNDVASGGRITLDFITAEHIFPISWVGRQISECAFATVIKVDDKRYLYIQLHVKENKKYVIYNHLYESANGGLEDVSMKSVKGFEAVANKVLTDNEEPQFIIGRFNIANNLDDTNPMGISVFANAIDVLKAIDIVYDSYVNEFILGKKRVMVQPSVTKTMDGDRVFDPNDVTFYVLPEDVSDGSLIQPIDMALRTEAHQQGIQDQLNMLSSKVGFGEKHYRFDSGGVATATQIISENSEMFRSIKKHEIVLESVLEKLCRVLLRLGNKYLGKHLNEDVEISIDFDDSIIEDKDVEFNRAMTMLSAGLMRPEEARSIIMNEDIETAKEALPVMEGLVDEGQDDVE